MTPLPKEGREDRPHQIPDKRPYTVPDPLRSDHKNGNTGWDGKEFLNPVVVPVKQGFE